MNVTEKKTKFELIEIKNIALATFLILALNLGFLVASWLTGTNRPLVNLDYAFALTLISFGLPALGLAFGLLFLLVDLLVLASQLFPFPRISDLLYLLKFTALTSTEHLLFIFGALAVLACKLVLLLRTAKQVTRLSALAALNILLAITFLLLIADNREIRSATYRKLEPLAVTSLASSFLLMRSSSFLNHFENSSEGFIPSIDGATRPWLSQTSDTTKGRLLLIIVESWGVTRNAEINSALLAPLRSLPTESFESGTVDFDGFTITGELRELCKLSPLHFNLRDTEAGFENCLPNRLQSEGYITTAMHGATSLMYDRRHWYPRAGFQESIFFEDRVWPRRCYSFPGACDYDMLPELERYFSQPGKRFMYWLTLNTHSPYDLRDIRDSRSSTFECLNFQVDKETETCRLLNLEADFFNNLAEQLRRESMMDMDIIIVGDHAPKLLNLQEREKAFVEGAVPWVRIKTHSMENFKQEE